MRLDKFLGDMEIGSRADLKRAIRKGKVTVNGELIRDPGFHVPKEASVSYCGQLVVYCRYVYYMLNKPAGVISATEDTRHKTVLDCIEKADQRKDLFPVGRLDIDTEGLLLLTNDGALAHALLAPSRHVEKVYRAVVKGSIGEEEITAFAKGLRVDEAFLARPAGLEVLAQDEETSTVQIRISEGKYHQIKRMFLAVGSEVLYLERIRMGSLELDPGLERGSYRALTEEEILCLKENRTGEQL